MLVCIKRNFKMEMIDYDAELEILSRDYTAKHKALIQEFDARYMMIIEKKKRQLQAYHEEEASAGNL